MFDISVTPALYDISGRNKSMIKYVEATKFQHQRSYSDKVAILHDINPTEMSR
jgi:hypothetical protein